MKITFNMLIISQKIINKKLKKLIKKFIKYRNEIYSCIFKYNDYKLLCTYLIILYLEKE